MPQVELRLGGLIEAGGRQIALGQTHALLEAIAATGSVAGAAQRLELSYRTAWDRIEALHAAFGCPLVIKTKGHGSALTDAGQRLRAALAQVLARFEQPLAQASGALARELERIAHEPAPRLRAALSHDPLVLQALADQAATTDAVTTDAATTDVATTDAATSDTATTDASTIDMAAIDAATMGSAEAVRRLLAGEVDLAGFHFGQVGDTPPAGSDFRTVFDDARFFVTPLLRREQGLMLAPGNPLAIGSIRDLAARGARFIHRQRGSGTRLWFERLLAEAGLDASALRAEAAEEFTHQAVGAVVASGAADAGMGVRPVAERFGLAFVPLGHETYFIAARRGLEARVRALRAAVEARLAHTPGYATAEAGKTPSRDR